MLLMSRNGFEKDFAPKTCWKTEVSIILSKKTSYICETPCCPSVVTVFIVFKCDEGVP